MASTMRLIGQERVKNLLAQLPRRVGQKGNRAAVSAGAAPIVKAAKAAAPRDTGTLKRAIGKKVKTYKAEGVAAAIIGAKRGSVGSYKGKNIVPTRYIHLVNNGSKHMQGTHFLTEAFYGTKDQAAELAGAKLKQVVEAEAAKLGKGS